MCRHKTPRTIQDGGQGDRYPREAQVLDAVVTLDGSLLDDFDVVDLLTDLTTRSARCLTSLPRDFLLADPLEQLRLLAATLRQPGLELFQLQAEEPVRRLLRRTTGLVSAGLASRFGGGQQYSVAPSTPGSPRCTLFRCAPQASSSVPSACSEPVPEN